MQTVFSAAGGMPALTRLAEALGGPAAFRGVLHPYFAWTTTTTMARYPDSADDVPDGLKLPRWYWDGLQR